MGPRTRVNICHFEATLNLHRRLEQLGGVHLHNVVQLQSGIWRRVDKNVRQAVSLVRHPI